jgi:hypothetical protein
VKRTKDRVVRLADLAALGCATESQEKHQRRASAELQAKRQRASEPGRTTNLSWIVKAKRSTASMRSSGSSESPTL